MCDFPIFVDLLGTPECSHMGNLGARSHPPDARAVLIRPSPNVYPSAYRHPRGCPRLHSRRARAAPPFPFRGGGGNQNTQERHLETLFIHVPSIILLLVMFAAAPPPNAGPGAPPPPTGSGGLVWRMSVNTLSALVRRQRAVNPNYDNTCVTPFNI